MSADSIVGSDRSTASYEICGSAPQEAHRRRRIFARMQEARSAWSGAAPLPRPGPPDRAGLCAWGAPTLGGVHSGRRNAPASRSDRRRFSSVAGLGTRPVARRATLLRLAIVVGCCHVAPPFSAERATPTARAGKMTLPPERLRAARIAAGFLENRGAAGTSTGLGRRRAHPSSTTARPRETVSYGLRTRLDRIALAGNRRTEGASDSLGRGGA
jgi:hypothetical protein